MDLQKKNAHGLDFLIKKASSKANKAVFLFHGYGASMDDLAPLAQFLDPQNQWDWYFPNGILEVPIGFMMTGRAWFPIDISRFEQVMGTNQLEELFRSKIPDGLLKAKDIAYTFTKNMSQSYDQIAVGGFSQGSMLSQELAFDTDLSISQLVLLSTTMIGLEHTEEMLNSPTTFPIFQSHGQSDPILPYTLAVEVKELLEKQEKAVEFHSFPGGHEIPMPVLENLQAFLGRNW